MADAPPTSSLPVYHADSKEKVRDVSHEDALAGLAAGKFVLPDGKYTLLAKNGSTFEGDAAQAQKAVASGHFTIESDFERGKREGSTNYGGTRNALYAASGRLLNEASLGATDALFNAGSSDYEKGTEEGIQEAHPDASMAGTAAGFAGSLLYGGGEIEKAGQAAERGVLALGKKGAEEVGAEKAAQVLGEKAATEAAPAAEKAATQLELPGTEQMSLPFNGAKTAETAATEAAPAMDNAAEQLGFDFKKTAPPGTQLGLDLATNPVAEQAESKAAQVVEAQAAAPIVEDAATQDMKAGLAKRIAASAAKYAVEGAIYSSPQAVVQAATGDPESAAESMLWGMGGGALLGSLAPSLGALADKAGELAGKVGEKLGGEGGAVDRFANERALKAVGFERGTIKKLAPDAREQIANQLFKEGLITPGSTAHDIGERVADLNESSGKGIGEVYKSLNEKLASDPSLQSKAFNPTTVAKRINDEIGTKFALDTPMYSKEKGVLDDIVASVAKFGENSETVDFDKAKEIKALFNKFKGDYHFSNQGDPAVEIRKAAKAIITQEIDAAANRLSPELGNDTMAKFLKYRQQYKLTKDIAKAVDNAQVKGMGNRFLSLTDWVAGAGMHSIPAAAPAILAKHWFENRGLALTSYAAKRLARSGESDIFPAMISIDSRKRLDASLKQIAPTLGRIATRATVKAEQMDPITHLLGKDANGLSKEQQFTKLSQQLSTLSSNPTALAQRSAQISSPFAQTSPDVANLYQQKMLVAHNYLAAAIPKQTEPDIPFSHAAPWKPSKADLQAFKDKAEIVANPMRAFAHLENGTLNSNHVDALNNVYPGIKREMQTEIMKLSTKKDGPKLPYQGVLKLSMLMGTPLHPSLTPQSVAALQAGYKKGGSGPGNDNGGSPAGKAIKINTPSLGTAYGPKDPGKAA